MSGKVEDKSASRKAADVFSRIDASIAAVKNLDVDVFGELVKKKRPCECNPPRFSDADCAVCPDPCEEV